MTPTPLRIGIVGQGALGAPIALRLLHAGHQLFTCLQGRAPREFAESRATQCTRASGVARRADIVVLLLADADALGAALFGVEGVAAGLSRGKTVIDLSGPPLRDTRAFAQRIAALGCGYLDARLCGDEDEIRAASSALRVRGPQAAFEHARPVLERIGCPVVRVGDEAAPALPPASPRAPGPALPSRPALSTSANPQR